MRHAERHLDPTLRRAALYARVSTEEQAMHGVSLDAQKERLRQYAATHGLLVTDIYVDEGISARKRYTSRPAFLRMLEDVRAEKIDVILFIKLDRWFRNVADYYEVQAILDRHRVRWIATEEDYDTATANGRLALNIKLAIAQDESDRTSERIKFVFSNMVKEGRVISGKTPMGYRIENKHAVIDEKSAPVVRALFDAYIDTRSQKEAAHRIFCRFGIRLDSRSVRRMLTNRWYLGDAYGIQNFCPPIVDAERFALASSLLATRSARQSRPTTQRVYLFSGLLFCKLCGMRMSAYACANKNADGSIRQSFLYYRCQSHVLNTCTMQRQINQSILEAELLKALDTYTEDYALTATHPRPSAPLAQTPRDKALAKIEKLKDLYLEDLIPREMYEKEYASLSLALQEPSSPIPPPSAPPLVPHRFSEAYDALSPERKKAFWSRAVFRILISPTGEAEVSFR